MFTCRNCRRTHLRDYSGAVATKLFKDSPTSEIRAPHRGAWLAMGVGVALLVVGAIVGVLLIQSGGDTSPTAEEAVPVTLSDWRAEAGEACAAAAAANPLLTAGLDTLRDPQNVADSDAAVRDLSAAIHDIPLPTVSSEDTVAVTRAIQAGEDADRAWAALPRQPKADDVDAAVELTDVFIASINALGADCPLG